MALEDLTGTKYLDSLVSANPTSGDDRVEGDDHIRGIKNVLKLSFPNVSGAVTPTHTELNYCDITTLGQANNSQFVSVDGSGVVDMNDKEMTNVQLTAPEINDTSKDHQYVVAVSELVADRTVTLPLLTGNDEFTFNDHTQTLTNKTLTSAVLNTGVSGTAVLDEDNMASDSATQLATQQSIKAYADSVGITTYTSTAYTTYTGGTNLTAANHSLGAVPDMIFVQLKCISADAGYSADDEIQQVIYRGAAGGDRGVQVFATSTQVGGVIGNDGMDVFNKTTGVRAIMAVGKWEIYLKAIKF